MTSSKQLQCTEYKSNAGSRRQQTSSPVWCYPLVITLSRRPTFTVVAWPIIGKYDAVHKTASTASRLQPGGDVEQPISLCANMTSSTKPKICNISLRHQSRTEPRPQVAWTKKFGEDRTCSSGDMIADRRTHTDRQTDTLIAILRAPYRGRSKKCRVSVDKDSVLEMPESAAGR